MEHFSPGKMLAANQLKTVTDVCRLCVESFNAKKTNKHNLLQGKDVPLKPDFTLALEELTGPVIVGEDLPMAVCTSCRTILTRYYRSTAEVQRLNSLVKEMSNVRSIGRKRCTASALSQERQRHETVVPPALNISGRPSLPLFHRDVGTAKDSEYKEKTHYCGSFINTDAYSARIPTVLHSAKGVEETQYSHHSGYFSVAWKNSETNKSEVTVPTPSTSTTPLNYTFTQGTTGGAVTSLTTISCSPLNNSGHSPFSRKLTISNEDMLYPSSRMKRKLWSPKNKEVKRSKVNSQQMSISPDSNNIVFVEDGSSSKGALNLVKVKTEPGDSEICAEMEVGLGNGEPKERYMETDTTATVVLPPSDLPHHLTSASNQMDGMLIVKKEEEEEEKEKRKRDHSAVEGGPMSAEKREAREDTDTKEGVKTEGAAEEENQQWLLLETQQQHHLQQHHLEKVKSTFHERYQYSETMETVTQERDQYREQVKQLTCQVKELEKQLGQKNKESDELKSKCERLQTELEELRRDTLSSSRPVERTLNGSSSLDETRSRNTEDSAARWKMTVSC